MQRARKIFNVLLVISSFIIGSIIYNKMYVINEVGTRFNKKMDMVKSSELTMHSVAYKEIQNVFNIGNVTSEDNHTLIDTQRLRINTIDSVCKAYPNIRSVNPPLQGIFYISGPLFYCNVPKLGSEFLKAFFPIGLQSKGVEAGAKGFSTKAFSFLNVGDPYERLYSAYKDKLFKPNMDFWPKLGQDVVRRVRQNSGAEPCLGCDVTFREIVQYVVTCHENGIILNGHLEPIHKRCNPCRKHFDFISRKETLSDDLVNLFDTLQEKGIVKDEVSVPTLENDIRSKHTISRGSITKVFEARKTYPAMSAYNLFLRHWSTYHIGGYILNQYEMPFSESEVKTIPQPQYESAVITAMANSRDQREQLKLQRHEALFQAYRSVPSKLLLRLREFMKPDCVLFSYDDKPDYIFNKDTYNYSITHIYMKGL